MDRQVRVRVEPWMEPAAAAGAWGLRDGHAVYARCGQMGRGGVCGERACASRASTGPPTTPVAAARGASPRAREGDRRCERWGGDRERGCGKGSLGTRARAAHCGHGHGHGHKDWGRGVRRPGARLPRRAGARAGAGGKRHRRDEETSDGRLVEPGCLAAAGQNTPCATRRNGQTMDWSNDGRGSPAPSLFLSGIDSFDQWSNHLTSGRLV